jgi:hypothetical protein
MVFMHRDARFTAAELRAGSDTKEETIQAVKWKLADSKPEDLLLVSTKDGQLASLVTAWQGVVNQHEDLFGGVQPGACPITRTVCANYADPNDRYQVHTDEGVVDIPQIVFRAQFSITMKAVPISEIIEYASIGENRPISHSVKFEVELADRKLDIHLHRVEQPFGALFTVQATSSNER